VAPCDWLGFLPVLYTTVASRLRTPSVHLPDESSDDTLEDFSESQKTPQEKLTGRRILLLWLPALCDLTGTTVRAFPSSPGLSHSYMCDWGSAAHERWLVVHSRVDLSNDAWCAGPVCRNSFSAVLAPQAVSLPVRHVSRYPALSLIRQRVLQMAVIVDCHGRSVSGWVQWFSYQGHSPSNCSISREIIRFITRYCTPRERAYRSARGN